MKFIVAFAVLFAVAAAFPQSQEAQATIARQESDIAPDHSVYRNSLETSNNIKQGESGQLKQVQGAESPSYAVSGEFSWTAPDGVVYTVKYTADENGFHPSALHLPVAPAPEY